MSNYSPIVNFAPKDALLTGDPAKKARGTEIAAELTAIATAITSKEDTSNKGIANGYAPLNASILLADTYLTTNIPRLDSTTNMFTGIQKVSSANPKVYLNETDGTANNRLWLLQANADDLTFSLRDDADATGATFLTVTRTLNVIDSITLNGVLINLTGQVPTIELGHATDTTLSRVSAGVVAVEGVNLVSTVTGDARYMKQGLVTVPIMAGAMQPATTNGPALASIETTTNKVLYKVLDFDQTTQEFAGFAVPFPKSYNNGTVTFQPIWTFSTGSGGVVWALQGVAVSDDDVSDVAYGTEQTSTDTALTAGDVHVGPTSAAITVAGTPATGDIAFFRVKRVPADGGDTLTGDARLIGVRLFFTQNAADDT